MARPTLIIEFSGSSVRAALFPAGSGEAGSYLSIPSAASIKDGAERACDAIRKETGADPAACAVLVGVGPSSVSMRVVSVPSEKRDKINDMLPFELAGTLPADASEFVMDNVPLGEGKAIAVAMEKTALAEYLDAFASLSLDPVWVGVAGLSMARLLGSLHPGEGTQAFIGHDFISVSKKDRLLFFNSFSGPAGLKLNIEYLDAEGVKIDEAYCAQDPGAIERLLPGANVTRTEPARGLPPEAASMAALALDAANSNLARTVNLRKGEFEYTKEKAAAGRKLRLTALLAVIIAALLLGSAYLRYAAVNRGLAAYRQALKEEYSRLFPNEKAAVDELYQLSAKMKEVERETAIVQSGPGVLELMQDLADAANKEPGLSIRLTELTVADGKIKAAGEAASFDAANRFKNLLTGLGHFKSVQISDLKSQGDVAAFSLLISVT